MPAVSVIIPTYNGEKRIINVLDSIRTQHYTDHEIIVVVDGSSDKTIDEIQKYKIKNKELTLYYVFQQNQGRAASRHFGVSKSRGSLLLFIDDDIRMSNNDFIAQHVNHHNAKKYSILVGMVLEEETILLKDIQKFKRFLSLKWIEKIEKYFPHPLPTNDLFITAANFSIPKTIYNHIGGFNPSLLDAEDYELALRASDFNIPIYFNKEIIGWHDDFITCKKYIKRQREYVLANQNLGNIAIDNKLPLHKYLVFYFFSFRIWPYLVDNFNILLVLPQPIRYTIYDYIITSQSKYFHP